MNIQRIIIFILVPFLYSCEKWEDKKAVRDPSLDDRKYCNDPQAVNYNWNFPGQADSTVCFYPSDIFKGTYQFTDSVYNADYSFDLDRPRSTYTLQIVALTRNKLAVIGFCGLNDSLKFTAERSSYRANVDSTIRISDTTFDYGQFFCRIEDTISGYISENRFDTTPPNKLLIEFMVRSDTGINFHRGTAIKQ